MWPKPMEGLDLFNPLNAIQSDSSSSDYEEDDDDDRDDDNEEELREEEELAARNNFSSPSSDRESDDEYMLEEKRRNMMRPKAAIAKPRSTNLLLNFTPKIPATLSNGNQREANGTACSNAGDFQVQKVCV